MTASPDHRGRARPAHALDPRSGPGRGDAGDRAGRQSPQQEVYVLSNNVTFTVDGVARPPAHLSSAGLARLQLSSLPAGTHTITATCNGDPNHATSTSAQFIQVVTAAAQITHTAADPGTEVTLRP